jgi:NDP-sugar pyrophosphorylase family protein
MTKKRISISIDKDLLKRIDKSTAEDENRSQVVEKYLKEGMGLNSVKTAVIQAGGRGTRLRPFTYEVPKPLIPVKGKALTEHTLTMLKRYGFEKVFISVGYMADKIIDHFGDGSNYGLDVEYIVEKKKLGTAGPLRKIEDKLTDSFLLIWCDILADIDLKEMGRFHKSHPGIATMALASVDDVSQLGVVEMRGDKIVNFIEKPNKGEEPSNLVNAGIAMLEPEVIKYIPQKGFSMIEQDVYPNLVEDEELHGYPFDGVWYDTGTPESYEKVIKNWKIK